MWTSDAWKHKKRNNHSQLLHQWLANGNFVENDGGISIKWSMKGNTTPVEVHNICNLPTNYWKFQIKAISGDKTMLSPLSQYISEVFKDLYILLKAMSPHLYWINYSVYSGIPEGQNLFYLRVETTVLWGVHSVTTLNNHLKCQWLQWNPEKGGKKDEVNMYRFKRVAQ